MSRDYEPLRETARRTAEEEARKAKEESERKTAGPQRYEPLRDTERAVAANREHQDGLAAERKDVDKWLAEREAELREKFNAKHISAHDLSYGIKQLHQTPLAEIEKDVARRQQAAARTERPSQSKDATKEPAGLAGSARNWTYDKSGVALKPAERSQSAREEDAKKERAGADKREAQSTPAKEMTDARAARQARLRGIEREIERDHQENTRGPQGRGDGGGRGR